MISADVDCDYGLTAVNVSVMKTNTKTKNRKYSSLNDVTLLGLQLKKTDKVVLKIEDPTLNINFQ